MRKHIFTAIILISILLAGCDTNAGTVNLTVNETSAEITEVTNETIHMNNCGSAGEVKQTAEKSKSVNVEYAGSFGVDKVVVNGEVSAKYGEINANAKKLELVAPAGTNMEFNLKWTEKTWVGIVTAQGKDGQANYKVSVPISVELVSSQDLGCGSSNSVPANPNPTTSSPPTQQSPQTNFSDITVTANANNGVLFTAPTSGNYTFTIKDGIYCTPSVCRSIIHGYLGRDVVWKDFYGLPHPMEQDYELGCWEDPTASNKNCAVGMSATVYMNAQQYIRWIIMEDKNAFADNKGAVILSVTATP